MGGDGKAIGGLFTDPVCLPHDHRHFLVGEGNLLQVVDLRTMRLVTNMEVNGVVESITVLPTPPSDDEENLQDSDIKNYVVEEAAKIAILVKTNTRRLVFATLLRHKPREDHDIDEGTAAIYQFGDVTAPVCLRNVNQVVGWAGHWEQEDGNQFLGFRFALTTKSYSYLVDFDVNGKRVGEIGISLRELGSAWGGYPCVAIMGNLVAIAPRGLKYNEAPPAPLCIVFHRLILAKHGQEKYYLVTQNRSFERSNLVALFAGGFLTVAFAHSHVHAPAVRVFKVPETLETFVKLFDGTEGQAPREVETLATISWHAHTPSCIAMSDKGRTIFTVGEEGVVVATSTATWTRTCYARIECGISSLDVPKGAPFGSAGELPPGSWVVVRLVNNSLQSVDLATPGGAHARQIVQINEKEEQDAFMHGGRLLGSFLPPEVVRTCCSTMVKPLMGGELMPMVQWQPIGRGSEIVRRLTRHVVHFPHMSKSDGVFAGPFCRIAGRQGLCGDWPPPGHVALCEMKEGRVNQILADNLRLTTEPNEIQQRYFGGNGRSSKGWFPTDMALCQETGVAVFVMERPRDGASHKARFKICRLIETGIAGSNSDAGPARGVKFTLEPLSAVDPSHRGNLLTMQTTTAGQWISICSSGVGMTWKVVEAPGLEKASRGSGSRGSGRDRKGKRAFCGSSHLMTTSRFDQKELIVGAAVGKDFGKGAPPVFLLSAKMALYTYEQDELSGWRITSEMRVPREWLQAAGLIEENCREMRLVKLRGENILKAVSHMRVLIMGLNGTIIVVHANKEESSAFTINLNKEVSPEVVIKRLLDPSDNLTDESPANEENTLPSLPIVENSRSGVNFFVGYGKIVTMYESSESEVKAIRSWKLNYNPLGLLPSPKKGGPLLFALTTQMRYDPLS